MTKERTQPHHDGSVERHPDVALAFALNADIAAAIDEGRDVSEVLDYLDPDPARFMSIAEGEGSFPEMAHRGHQLAAAAPSLPGKPRTSSELVPGANHATHPAIARAADGATLFAWLEWLGEEGEHLIARLEDVDGTHTTTTLTACPGDVVRPVALFSADCTPWVFYSAREAASGFTVRCRRFQDGAWTPEEVVSDAESPSFNQECAARADGSIEVCWQGREGSRFAIYTRVWRDGNWGETRKASDDEPENVWDPVIVAAPDGGTLMGWCEFIGDTYRVVVVHVDASGDVTPVGVPLASRNEYALHPSLAALEDGSVWCAFDVVSIPEHGGSGPTRLRRQGESHHMDFQRPGEFVPQEVSLPVESTVKVVRCHEGDISEVDSAVAAGLVTCPSGMPKLVASGKRLLLTYRVLRRLPLLLYYWEVALQHLGPNGWSAPTTFRNSDGPLEEAEAAATEDGAILVWQTDGRLERGLTWSEGFGGSERLELAAHHGEVIWNSTHSTGKVAYAAVSAPDDATLAPLVAARSRPTRPRNTSAQHWRDARAETQERYTTTVAGQSLSLYWGDLHRHSLVSRCTAGDEPPLEDFYRFAWDVCRYDFWAVTDHAENTSAYQWWAIQKMADLFHVDGVFVPFYGFEWTGLEGHYNVIYESAKRNAPIFSSRAKGQDTPRNLWERLREFPQFPAITIPHHPGCSFVPFQWDYRDDSMVRLVEIFQACRGNYEFDGCFRQYADGTLPGTFVHEGLGRGHKFGLIASSDHGYGAAYVGAFAPNLARPAIFDALHSRRTFACTTRNLVMDVRIGDTFMGQELEHAGGEPLDVEIFVRGYCDMARVDVIRNGELWQSVEPNLGLQPGWVSVPVRVEWGGASSARIWDGRIDVSSGEILQTDFWGPEVTAVSRTTVKWRASTAHYGEHFGGYRGGVEFTLLGTPNATVKLQTAQGNRTFTLGELQDEGTLEVNVEDARLVVQPGTGGLASLGSREVRATFTDTPMTDNWYYVRAIQVDGEMAWSSPIWVSV